MTCGEGAGKRCLVTDTAIGKKELIYHFKSFSCVTPIQQACSSSLDRGRRSGRTRFDPRSVG